MQDQTMPAGLGFADDGIVFVPAFEPPPSVLARTEARAAQAMRANMPIGMPLPDSDIAIIRFFRKNLD